MQGYDVVLVHEASETLSAMKGNSHPDLVLLSYKLPGLTGPQVSASFHVLLHTAPVPNPVPNGLQVVRAIRQSHCDLPIFALSQATDNTAAAIKGDLYGGAVQDWLRLPADVGEAIARVEGALRHQVQTLLMFYSTLCCSIRYRHF